MRIAHLTSVHHRCDTRILIKECRSLAASGHDVTLVVADGEGSALDNGVTIVDVGASHSRINRMIWGTQRVRAAAIALDADVYHFHDPELIPTGLALKRSGKWVIFDAHEDVEKQVLNKPYLIAPLRRMLSWGYARYESRRVRLFDAVVAATPFIRDKYMALHPHVIDINNFPKADELALPVSWEGKEKAVCYVGGIDRIRGIMEMVASLSKTSRPVTLHLAGRFTDSEEDAKALPGWSAVKAWGQVNRLGVRDILGRSLAGLVTLHPVVNYLDSLPVKMFEYMAAGIPVVASHFPLWRDIIEGNRCGICVDPMNPAAIAKAIDTLIGDPVLAREMGSNGRRAVVEKYNWAVEERKLLALYASLK